MSYSHPKSEFFKMVNQVRWSQSGAKPSTPSRAFTKPLRHVSKSYAIHGRAILKESLGRECRAFAYYMTGLMRDGKTRMSDINRAHRHYVKRWRAWHPDVEYQSSQAKRMFARSHKVKLAFQRYTLAKLAIKLITSRFGSEGGALVQYE